MSNCLKKSMLNCDSCEGKGEMVRARNQGWDGENHTGWGGTSSGQAETQGCGVAVCSKEPMGARPHALPQLESDHSRLP